MTLTLEELQNGSTDTETTSDTSDNSDDELRAVCEELGADYDHVKEYIDENGNKSDVLKFARRLRDNPDLWAKMADYRRMNSMNRIIRKYLRSDDKEYTQYTGAFYGDSDDPVEGTYNFVQQRAREADGNLFWYQALFPEPVEEKWPSEPVLWQQFDTIGYSDEAEQDTHIFVERDFVEEYGDFTITVNGDEKPRPPANSELASGVNTSSDGGLVVDPSDHTVEELRDALQEAREGGASPEDFEAVLQAEESGKDRKTAKKAIRGTKNQAGSGSSDGEQQDLEAAAAAGEMNHQQGADVSPEKVIELMDKGFSKDEIVAMFG